MRKLLMENGDGDLVLLSTTPSHLRGVLRWLASRGDPSLEKLCAPLADEIALEEKVQEQQERRYGEPIVVLKAGRLEAAGTREGEELSLAEVDRYLGFKYCAAQMALQRAKKDGSFVGMLLKDTCPFTDKEIENDENKAEDKRIAVGREVRFCRVSDFPLLFEKYPEAAERWTKNKAREEFEKLPQAEQDRIRAEEHAAFIAARNAKYAAEGGAQ